MIACFWAEHHVRRRTRAFDENWVTEAITAMFLRYLMISYGELTQCILNVCFSLIYTLDDAKAVSCGVTSCSCSRFESSKLGHPAAPLLQAAAFVPPEAMKTALKHNQGIAPKDIALWRFYDVLSCFLHVYHWNTPFFLVLCRFFVVYVVSYSFTVHPRAWKQRCHRKVKASCAVWGQEIGATKPNNP